MDDGQLPACGAAPRRRQLEPLARRMKDRAARHRSDVGEMIHRFTAAPHGNERNRRTRGRVGGGRWRGGVGRSTPARRACAALGQRVRAVSILPARSAGCAPVLLPSHSSPSRGAGAPGAVRPRTSALGGDPVVKLGPSAATWLLSLRKTSDFFPETDHVDRPPSLNRDGGGA